MNHGGGDLRLTRGGFQMIQIRAASGILTIGWKKLEGMIGGEKIVR